MPKHSIISEDEECFHVHDGEKNFIVAKKGLHNNLHEKIRALPKYAQGGIVDEEPEEETTPEWMKSGFTPGHQLLKESLKESSKPKISRERVEAAMANPEDAFAKNYPGELKSAAEFYGLVPAAPVAETVAGPVPASVTSPEEIVAEVPETMPAAVAQPQVQTAGSPIMQQLRAGEALQARGIQEEADNAAKLAQEQQAIYEKQFSPEIEKQNQERAAQLQARMDQINKENDALYEAAFNNKIDPNRVWNNMSTGNRVMATIGIILGGLGSGGNAENNAAVKAINKAIDDDIGAQIKAGENSKQLYQLNLQRYRDTEQAFHATKMQMTAIAQGQLAAMAAKYGGKNAQARAYGLLGALKTQNAVTEASVLEKIAQSSGQNKENFVPGYGYAQVKPSEEDKNSLASASTIRKGLKELQQRAIKGGPTIKGSSFDSETKTKMAAMKLQLKTLFKLGQISETDAALIDPLVADPGALRTEKAVRQLKAAEQVVDSIEETTLAKLGLQRPQQIGGGRVRVSNGKETLMIDPSDLGAAQKDGYKRVK